MRRPRNLHLSTLSFVSAPDHTLLASGGFGETAIRGAFYGHIIGIIVPFEIRRGAMYTEKGLRTEWLRRRARRSSQSLIEGIFLAPARRGGS
jgi:hypothetical protein